MSDLDELISQANQGNPEAQFHLGLAYQEGEGVEKDMSKAISLFRLSAEQGNEKAMIMLEFEEAAQGIEQAEASINRMRQEPDMAEVVAFHRAAAESGDAVAQNFLGIAYEEGLGVARDCVEAARWYRLAAEQGHKEAATSLNSSNDCSESTSRFDIIKRIESQELEIRASPFSSMKGRWY